MSFSTVAEFFEKLQNVVSTKGLNGLEAKVQLILTGDEQGEWGFDLEKDSVNILPGRLSHPQITITADSADYLKLVNGELDPINAYMSGVIRISGDLGMVMSLAPLFKIK